MTELHKRYARALYALCPDAAAFDAAAGALLSCPELTEALQNPRVTRAEKEAVLDRVLESGTSPALAAFFRLLCRHGRFSLLPGIRRAFRTLDLESHNAADAVMRAAFLPTRSQREAISAALAREHGRARVELCVVHDPALLGGFVLQMGDETYDQSVLGAMRALQQALISPK